MSLSSVSGRQYLSICSAFWTVYLEMSFRNWIVGKYYLIDGEISKGFFFCCIGTVKCLHLGGILSADLQGMFRS